MERTEVTVLELTKSCMRQSQQLLSLHGKDSKYGESLGSKIMDFGIWAQDVGALSKSPEAPLGPLDYKLKDRGTDLALVKNFLVILSDSLEYLTDIPEADPNVDRGIRNLDSALRNLALVGMALRRLGKASRTRRADKSFKQEDHQELRKHLECVILLRPSKDGHFKKNTKDEYLTRLDYSELSGLQKRLIEANLRRRHSFLMAQKVQKDRTDETSRIQSSIVPSPAVNKTQNVKDSMWSEGPTPMDSPVHKRKQPIVPSKYHLKGPPTISTAEGSFRIPSLDENYAPGAAKTDITWTAFDPKFPRPPRNYLHQLTSRCPCCCQSLPARIFKSPKLWEQHLNEDVCPYTCIAEDCPTPRLLFITADDMQRHIEQDHSPQWECPFCALQHTRHPNRESIEDHLRNEHGERLLHNSLSTLVSWCKTHKMGLTACPLCSSSGPEDSAELTEHVLHHTYEFALRALPWPRPPLHHTNTQPGSFQAPATEGVQRWLDKLDTVVVPGGDESYGLKLCDYDRQDHSDPTDIGPWEYGDFFLNNCYFDESSDSNNSHNKSSIADQLSAFEEPSTFDVAQIDDGTPRSATGPNSATVDSPHEDQDQGIAQNSSTKASSPQVVSYSAIRRMCVKRIDIGTFRNPEYLPQDGFGELLTADRVAATIQAHVHYDDEVSKLRLIEYSMRNPRIFLTLAATDLLKRMPLLSSANFTEEYLPIRCKDDEELGLQVYSASDPYGLSPLECFAEGSDKNSWGLSYVEHFVWKQWAFRAATFERDRFEFEIHPHCPLPYFELDSQLQPATRGYFKHVFKLGLREDHIMPNSKAYRHLRRPPHSSPVLEVAVQQLHIDGFHSQIELDRVFERGVAVQKSTRNLDDEHVIQAITAYKRGAERYIVFPWASNGNLRQFWSQTDSFGPTRQPPMQWAWGQIRGLARGLARLHDADIRHGDIKPENILVFESLDISQPGTLVIADVGISKFHSEDIQMQQTQGHGTTNRHGTLRYEPPEIQVLRTGVVSRKHDSWSFGCILIEFIVWLLHGNSGLDRFNEELRRESPISDTFWDRGRDGNPILHPVVESWRKEVLSGEVRGIRELVTLVAQSLLVTSPESRASINDFYEAFEKVYAKL